MIGTELQLDRRRKFRALLPSGVATDDNNVLCVHFNNILCIKDSDPSSNHEEMMVV